MSDYDEFMPDLDKGKESLGSNSMAALEGLVAEQLGYEKEIKALEQKISDIKADLRTVSTKKIPMLMLELGIEEFKTSAGAKVKVGEKLEGSLPKTDQIKRANALKWLEENGAGDSIKRTFVISFSKDDMAWANKFEADLKKRKKPVPCERKADIHPQTLAKVARELKDEGVDVPLSDLGLFEITKTVIKEDKPKKKPL